MSVIGNQLILRRGTRAYFDRDAIGGVIQPTLEFGSIKSCNPTFDENSIQFKDSGDGITRTLLDQIIERTEKYEIVFSNLNWDMQAILFGAEPPSDYIQAALAITGIAHTRVYEGRLLMLYTDDSNLNRAQKLTSVDEVSGIEYALGDNTAGIAGAVTIKIAGDHHTEFLAGDKIFIRGNHALLNGIKTVDINSTFASSVTTITLTEAVATVTDSAGTVAKHYIKDTDWQDVDLDNGIIRIIDGGGISDLTPLSVDFTQQAIEGKRVIYPQSAECTVTGVLELRWTSADCATTEKMTRRMRVSIKPTGMTTGVEDYNTGTVTVTVLADPTNESQPAGTYVYTSGQMPALS